MDELPRIQARQPVYKRPGWANEFPFEKRDVMRGSCWVYIIYIVYYEQLICCNWLTLPQPTSKLRQFAVPKIASSSRQTSPPSRGFDFAVKLSSPLVQFSGNPSEDRRSSARPVARARQEGSRPSNRCAPARTGGRENVLRPAARWPSLGGPGLGRFLYCFLPNSPDRVVTRRRGSASNMLLAIRALLAIRRGKAAFWSAHATAPGHQERHRCCSSWPG